MTRQAVVRRLFGPMTGDAEAHVQIDHALRDGLLCDVAVARRAGDVGAEVRSGIEPYVSFSRVAVDALPRNVDSAFLVVGELLNDRTLGRDRIVADHAGLDARQTGDRAFGRAVVTVVGARQALRDVHGMGKRDRLLGIWTH